MTVIYENDEYLCNLKTNGPSVSHKPQQVKPFHLDLIRNQTVRSLRKVSRKTLESTSPATLVLGFFRVWSGRGSEKLQYITHQGDSDLPQELDSFPLLLPSRYYSLTYTSFDCTMTFSNTLKRTWSSVLRKLSPKMRDTAGTQVVLKQENLESNSSNSSEAAMPLSFVVYSGAHTADAFGSLPYSPVYRSIDSESLPALSSGSTSTSSILLSPNAGLFDMNQVCVFKHPRGLSYMSSENDTG